MADTCDQLESCALPCPAEWEPKADLIEVYGVSADVDCCLQQQLSRHTGCTDIYDVTYDRLQQLALHVCCTGEPSLPLFVDSWAADLLQLHRCILAYHFGVSRDQQRNPFAGTGSETRETDDPRDAPCALILCKFFRLTILRLSGLACCRVLRGMRR